MSARILDGRKRQEEIIRLLKGEVASLKVASTKRPRLISLQLGKDSASSIYITAQTKIAASVGIDYELITITNQAPEDKTISALKSLSRDSAVTGIIIQRPLPAGVNIDRVYSLISPFKDVEGLCAENMGRLFFKNQVITPPTIAAIMELIRLSNVKLYGKEAVIVGHSEIIGKPLAIVLLNEFATVSICHIATSKKGRLADYIRKAEVLIVAVGKPNLIKGEWIKKAAIVIDVGINSISGKIVGDVEFESAKRRASYISPVPGGVGPLTTAMLMKNCITLFKLQQGIK